MIDREERGDVLVVRINHGKANALDLELLEALAETFRELAADPPGAVVITGTGVIFSAGVDLFRMLGETREYLAAFLPALSDALEQMFLFPRPLAAAVNGHAIAGGAIIAAACDYRVGPRSRGRLGVPELLVGVPFPAWPLEIICRVVPREYQAEVIYGGGTYEGESALRVGLLDELETGEAILEAGLTWARTTASLSVPAFAITKSLLRSDSVERVRARTIPDQDLLDVWDTPETRERIRVYLDRTIGKG